MTEKKKSVNGMGQKAIASEIAKRMNLSASKVQEVFDNLVDICRREMGTVQGQGVFVIAGLVKLVLQNRPYMPPRTRPHPFKEGETIKIRERKAATFIRIRPLKLLKQMVVEIHPDSPTVYKKKG